MRRWEREVDGEVGSQRDGLKEEVEVDGKRVGWEAHEFIMIWVPGARWTVDLSGMEVGISNAAFESWKERGRGGEGE